MAFYAVDDDDMIFAGQAERDKVYWCLDCFGPVKRRLGKNRLPHFFHIHPTPHCRLYSKTADHLLAQLQLQKQFPPQVLQMERPFLKINRVADLCWESEKIVFEIQCSPLSPVEAEARIRDYRTEGYETVWLLDDKRYNKRVIRPAEDYLRRHSTYYMSIKQGLTSEYYDQFEIFAEGRRVKKSKRMPIDLQKIHRAPTFDEDRFPRQIAELDCRNYFHGDRIHRALTQPLAMQNWRALEVQLSKPVLKPNWFRRTIGSRYRTWLQNLLSKVR